MEQPTSKVDSETLLESLHRRAMEIQKLDYRLNDTKHEMDKLEFTIDQLKAGLMRDLRKYEIK